MVIRDRAIRAARLRQAGVVDDGYGLLCSGEIATEKGVSARPSWVIRYNGDFEEVDVAKITGEHAFTAVGAGPRNDFAAIMLNKSFLFIDQDNVFYNREIPKDTVPAFIESEPYEWQITYSRLGIAPGSELFTMPQINRFTLPSSCPRNRDHHRRQFRYWKNHQYIFCAEPGGQAA